MRRSFCKKLGGTPGASNYTDIFSARQEAFALCVLNWFFRGKLPTALVSRYMDVFYHLVSKLVFYTHTRRRLRSAMTTWQR
jgi:hypothetical protein